jgi:hypothetical protein
MGASAGSQRFISVLSKSYHCALSWTRYSQSVSSRTEPTVFLGTTALPKRVPLFPSYFWNKFIYAFLRVLTRILIPPHTTRLDVISLIFGAQHKSKDSSCSFLRPPAVINFFDRNILLDTLLSQPKIYIFTFLNYTNVT